MTKSLLLCLIIVSTSVFAGTSYEEQAQANLVKRDEARVTKAILQFFKKVPKTSNLVNDIVLSLEFNIKSVKWMSSGHWSFRVGATSTDIDTDIPQYQCELSYFHEVEKADYLFLCTGATEKNGHESYQITFSADSIY